MAVLTFNTFQVEVPPDWEDVTNELKEHDAPPTLAKDFGMLQVSVRPDAPPCADAESMLTKLHQLTQGKGLGEPFDIMTEEGSLAIASASFQSGKEFVRIWYLTDRKQTALATYLCAWEHQKEEGEDLEKIIRNLELKTTT